MKKSKRRRRKNPGSKGATAKTTGDAGEFLRRGLESHQKGRLAEAVRWYRKALASQPDLIAALGNLGLALESQGEMEEAIDCYEKIIALRPDDEKAHNNLGLVMKSQGRLEEASAYLQKAVELKPGFAEAHNNLGNVQKERGEVKEALASFDRAIAHKPDFAEARYNASQSRKCADPAEVGVLEALLKKETGDAGRVGLHFALGKALADLERYPEAFRHYLEANRLVRKGVHYDAAGEEGTFQRHREIFDRAFFESRQDFGAQDDAPIFIVGMMRSGTTLIEQILASHPEVHGAGELPYITRMLEKRAGSREAGRFPEALAQLNADESRGLGEAYLATIRRLAPDARFVTDKMPSNFLHLGAIRLLLPRARIIHAVRAPEDICLSIFRTRFTDRHAYAYNLAEIGHYYRLYQGMMDHWRDLFPASILDVSYEQLTADQEGESRRILDHCGLSWDDRCLRFHETVRDVTTASSVQVRQPMHQKSVGGWRRYEQQMRPFLQALQE